MNTNKEKQSQPDEFNFLKKKAPIAPQVSAKHKGELASNFLNESGN